MVLHAAHQEAGDGQDWRARFDATVQHLALLKRKEERLRAARIDAEGQLLHALAGAYADGLLSPFELGCLYDDFVAVAAPRWRVRWDAAMPISSGRAKWLVRDEPNGPHGSWFGTEPIGNGAAPPAGACVVYVLFDAANVPCYVGSSKNFRERIGGHRHDKGGQFVRWVAYPCADREAAYQLEEKLLAEHRPYLNKKVSR